MANCPFLEDDSAQGSVSKQIFTLSFAHSYCSRFRAFLCWKLIIYQPDYESAQIRAVICGLGCQLTQVTIGLLGLNPFGKWVA